MPVGNAVPTSKAVRHVVVTTVVVVLGHLAATVLAYLVAGPTGSTDTFVVAQTLTALVALLALTRWRAGAGLAAGLPAARWTGLPVVAAYLLLPSTWVGQALFGRQLLDLAPVGVVLDLLVWVGVTALGLRWAASQGQLRPAPLTPYG